MRGGPAASYRLWLHNPAVYSRSTNLRHWGFFRKAVSSACFISKSSCEPKPGISKVLLAILHLRCFFAALRGHGVVFHKRTFTLAELPASLTDSNLFVVTQRALELVVSPRNIPLSPRLLAAFFPPSLFHFFFRKTFEIFKNKRRRSPSILSFFCMFLCSEAVKAAVPPETI